MSNAIGFAILFMMFMGVAMLIPGAVEKQVQFNERMTAHHFSQYGGM